MVSRFNALALVANLNCTTFEVLSGSFESYEVYSAGHLELTVEAINTFKKTDLKFADGTVWELHPHLSGYTVHDDDQVERLRATREILSFLGRAHISSDDRLERDQLLPLLIMLLHLCTHSNTSGGLH